MGPATERGSALLSASSELIPAQPETTDFRVALDVFNGPFELLLQLINRHELDITEVSLSLVTDEFIARIADMEGTDGAALDEMSEFLEVAATLLDMKIARLLPQGAVVDAADVAALEARDLLFARLLQYRAFVEASQWFAQQLTVESQRQVRSIAVAVEHRAEPAALKWTLSLQEFGVIAAAALAPKELPTVTFEHLHAPAVSLHEQTLQVVQLLQEAPAQTLSFRALISTNPERSIVVARFLAILELHRRSAVTLTQQTPLGELLVCWSATEWSPAELDHLGGAYG